ncbi:MAG: isoprenylcysteine carboxylmethyltransferase family protein [Acidobacteria bacterium]|nr:isoprenylcysteine carboxylmethyltransferase family protein [Acidobacteriota bacterium]MBV9477684.1 isoprenylcysteine carboxylmethyltransferase family protein [Acidobacteriota bacterium]
MIRKLLTALLASCAIYGLPALAHPDIFRTPQFWILIAFAVGISAFQPAYKPVDASAPKHDRGTAAQIVWSVYLTQLIGILEAVFVRYPDSFRWDAVTTAALVLMAAGLALRVWAVLTLGRFFTWFITVYEDHQVIRTGPFRFIRHPSYGGALLLFVGTLLFIHAWVGAALSLAFQLFAYVRRIRYEEAMMIERLGKPYVVYTREVRALVPLLW